MTLAICCPQDFERERNSESVLQSMSLKKFARLIFQECPGLAPFSASLDKIYKAFAEYKQVRYPSFAPLCLKPVTHAYLYLTLLRNSHYGVAFAL